MLRSLGISAGIGVLLVISDGAICRADGPAQASLPADATNGAPAAASPTPATNATAPAKAAAKLENMSLEDLMNIEVATVTTASKAPEKAIDAPATVIVITAQDIRLRGYANLKDVLRDMPGMDTTENYFSEIGTLVPVRGIVGNNLIVVLVNGMRVNPPGGEYFPLRSDFSVRDAEQIEVIYGPGSTLYGQDAISAVINVKTKKPVEGKLGELVLDGGLYSEREGFISFGKHFVKENFSLTGYFEYHDSDLNPINTDYPDFWKDYATFSQNQSPRGLGDPPVRRDFGLNGFTRLEGENWSVQGWFRQSERSSAEAKIPQQSGYLDQAKWGDDSLVLEARDTIPFSNTLSLESALSYNRYEIEPSSRYVNPTSSNPNLPIAPGTPGSWFFRDNKYGIGKGITDEEDLRWQVNPKLSLLTGIYVGAFDIIPKATIPGGANPNGNIVAQGEGANALYYTTQTGPVSASNPLITVPRVTRDRYQTYAGFLELGWQITPTLKAIAGTRVTGDTRLSEIPVTPRASLIYNITDHLTAKYIYTQAFVAPPPYFRDLTYDDGTHISHDASNFGAEKATSNEINLNYAVRNLNLGASAYYGRQSNLIISSESIDTGPLVEERDQNGNAIGPRQLISARNGGQSQNAGFDLFGRATFGEFSPWASYSYVNSQISVPGTGFPENESTPGVSKHSGRLGVTWAATPKLFITPSLVIRSTPENVLPSNGVTTYHSLARQLDTPYHVDLAVEYRVSESLSFFATIQNLTDHKYALGGFNGDGHGKLFALPGETINGVLGMRYQF